MFSTLVVCCLGLFLYAISAPSILNLWPFESVTTSVVCSSSVLNFFVVAVWLKYYLDYQSLWVLHWKNSRCDEINYGVLALFLIFLFGLGIEFVGISFVSLFHYWGGGFLREVVSCRVDFFLWLVIVFLVWIWFSLWGFVVVGGGWFVSLGLVCLFKVRHIN